MAAVNPLGPDVKTQSKLGQAGNGFALLDAGSKQRFQFNLGLGLYKRKKVYSKKLDLER
jgi:hypothetical protein